MFSTILAFTTDPMIALGVTLLIFLITMFLVAKQIIGFSMTFLLLIFALVTGILMNNHTSIDNYLTHENVSDTSIIESIKNEMIQQNQLMINRLDVIEKDLSHDKEERKQMVNSIQEMKNQFASDKKSLEQLVQTTKEDLVQKISESRSHTSDHSKVTDKSISEMTNLMTTN